MVNNIYVIELDKEVLKEPKFLKANPNYKPGKKCFYVGETAKTPENRFEDHKKGNNSNKFVKKYGIIFILVCLQGFLGWYMVSSGLVNRIDVSHYRLSIHLITAFIILSIIFWNFLELTELKINQISIKLNFIKFFLFLLFIQLIIGAFVSGMDAGNIYNTWPLMGSTYFPDDSRFNEFLNIKFFDNPSIVQFIHRNLAYIIFAVYIYLLFSVFK